MQFINIFIPDTMTCKIAKCCIRYIKNSYLQPFWFLQVLPKKSFISLSSKIVSMKRKLFYAAALVLMTLSNNSCSKLACKVCAQNTYNSTSGTLITSGTSTEYCDAELVKIEATPDVTVLGVTTKWECK
jgi:hypothetical protein